MKKLFSEKKIYQIILVILVVSIAPVYFMKIDSYLSGDEVVTYGMANSDNAWMLSKGRVNSYLENEIAGEGVADTLKNISESGMNILKNRKQAAYFQYPREMETGWYSREIARGWFCAKQRRFSFGRVYFNAMGDDANSFLYYMMVHVASSLMGNIGRLKWQAFSVNYIAFVITLLLLYQIAKYYVKSEKALLCVCLCYGVSVAALDIITYLRTYMVTSAFQLALFYFHLKLWTAYKADDRKVFQHYTKLLLLIYPLGYVAHYTTGLWAVALGIYTIYYMYRIEPVKTKKEYLKKYIVRGVIAIGTGILIDPISMIGLLSKLSGTAGGNLCAPLAGGLEAVIKNIFGNMAFFLVFLLIGIINIICIKRQNRELIELGGHRELFLFLFFYCLILVLVMKQAYFKAIYPLFFIVVVCEIYFLLSDICKNRNTGKICAGIIFFMFAVTNYCICGTMKKDEVVQYETVQRTLADIKTDRLVFIRGHAQAYEFFPLLTDYESTLVITNPEECLTDIEVEEFENVPEISVLVTGGKEDMFLDWAETISTREAEIVYQGQDDDVCILRWDERRE